MIWLHEMLELGNVAPNANYEMERMEERKRRDFYIGGGSHTQGVLHWLGRPLGYCPYAALPQENSLIWEPPLQL